MSEQLVTNSNKIESTSMDQFGARLQEVREGKGLTIETVAAELRLNSNLIKALEDNDTANLPSKIFVMGYLRSYSRLLGIDERELEQPDLSEINQPIDVKPGLLGPSDKNSKHISVRLVTYLVIAGILFLLVTWWLSIKDDFSEIMAIDEDQPYEASSDNRLSLPGVDSELSEPGNSVEIKAEQQPVEVLKIEVKEVKEVSQVKKVKEIIKVREPTVAIDDDIAVIRKTDAEIVLETPVEDNIADDDMELIAQSELTITYREGSWTEVYDATESRLLYGLYKQGHEEIVNGVAPFTLFFGNVSGVEISLNGESVEYTTYHEDGVARFKVGSAEVNQLPETE